MGNMFSNVAKLSTVQKGLINPSLMSKDSMESKLSMPKPVEPVGPAPTVAAPEVMPDQQAIEASKKKSLAEQLASRGRASTILTDSNDKLGG